MKNIKRIIPVLLIFILVTSMMSFASAANPGLIEDGKTGSIAIHKFDDTGTATGLGSPGNGTEIASTTGFGNPLNGITFTATLIPDATSATTIAEAQADITAMDETELDENQHTGITGSGLNADGVYTFANLVQGIYLVEEVANSGIADLTSEAFLVSIPMTNPADQSSWLYDVHAYPKNTLTDATIEKDVLDISGDKQSSISASIGDDVKWVITATIPGGLTSIDAGDPTTGYFFITDSLDSRLNYKSILVELVSPDDSRETLTTNTHYRLAAPSAGTPGTEDDDIKVDFKTTAGLLKLSLAPIGSTIEITITTTINNTAVENLSTEITNSAELYFNNKAGDPDDPDDPIVPEDPDPPEINLAGIAIMKVDENGDPLDDAIFTIYQTNANAEAGTAIQLSGSAWTETSGESVVVTDSTPAEYIEGYIYFSGAVLKSLGLNAIDATYYFVETTAPAGYKLLNTIYALDTGTTTPITNVPKPGSDSGFVLPITGGSGPLLFTIIGILLIGGAVTMLIISRRKKRSALK